MFVLFILEVQFHLPHAFAFTQYLHVLGILKKAKKNLLYLSRQAGCLVELS